MSQNTSNDPTENQATETPQRHAQSIEPATGESEVFEDLLDIQVTSGLLDLSLLDDPNAKRASIPENPAPAERNPAEISQNSSSQPPIEFDIYSDPTFMQCIALLREQLPEDASRILLISLNSEPDLRRSIPMISEFDKLLTGDAQITTPARHTLPWLVYAFILQPESPRWPQKLMDSAQDDAEKWISVIDTILRYIKYTSSPEILYDFVTQNCTRFLDPAMRQDLMLKHFSVAVRFDDFFDMILAVPENIRQPNLILEKLDNAIENHSGDASQRIALLIKKYKLSRLIGDYRDSLSAIRDILEASPNDPFALECLQSINPQDLKLHTQILYYQLRIFTEKDTATRLQYQLSLAMLYTKSSQFNNAITLYHAIIDDHPEQLDARYRLLTLLESQESWKSAENVLLALINADTAKDEKFNNLVRLAILQADHMSMPSRALLSLFAAADLCPEKLGSLHDKMCLYSERMHSYTPLLDKYEDLSEHAESYETRRNAIMLIANLYADHLKKPALACNALDEFYQKHAKDDLEFIRQVCDFYKEIGHWNGYVQSLSDLLAASTDNDQKVAIALEIANVYAVDLGDHVKAAQYAKTAAEFSPREAHHWVEIANYLLACEDVESTIQALEQAAQLEQDPAQKAMRYFEIAQLLSNIDRLDQATRAFDNAVRISPDLDQVTPVAESLIAHATAVKNKRAFLSLCSALVSCCPEAEQSNLMLQQALTLIRVFNDKNSARSIIEENTPKLSAIDLNSSYYLAQILTELDEHRAAIKIVQKILKKFTLDPEQRMLCLQTWLVNAAAIRDNPQIEEAAKAILQIDPEDCTAGFHMIRLDYIAGRWDLAAAKINRILQHMERLNAENAMYVHYYYGVILHASKNDDEAVDHLNSALSIENTFRPAVDLKLTILLENKKWQQALPVFTELINLTEDKEVLGAIHKRVAEVYHFYLENTEKAIFEYELALTLGGDIEDVPYRLLQLYQAAGLWDKAAMTAQILAMAQTNSPNAKCDYLATLGDIQATHLGELNDATNTLLSAFEISPLKQNIVTPLVHLLTRRQDWSNLRSVINAIASHLESNPHDAASRIAWISQTCARLPQCKAEIDNAIQKMRDLNIPMPTEQTPSPSQVTLSPSNDSRKRTTTSPRGSLTVDSSLLRNPDPPRPNSAVSMMTVPATPLPITVAAPSSDTPSQNDIVTSQNDIVTSQNDAITSQNDAITSQNDAITSQNDAIELDDIPFLPDDAISSIEDDLPFVPDDAISVLPILQNDSKDA